MNSKPGALTRGEPTGAAVVEAVAVDDEVGRAALDVHAPVVAVVDPAADDVAVLDGDEVDGVLVGARDVAVLDVHVLGLVHLQALVERGAGDDRHVAEEHVVALLEVHGDVRRRRVAAAGDEPEPEEVQVPTSKTLRPPSMVVEPGPSAASTMIGASSVPWQRAGARSLGVAAGVVGAVPLDRRRRDAVA